jgi:hypothetical protein
MAVFKRRCQSCGLLPTITENKNLSSTVRQALIRFLSDALDIPRSQLSVASGETGRNKAILITGITREALISLLKNKIL